MLTAVSIDQATLPMSLLPLFKKHSRVNADDDDQIIAQKIGAAIGLFQRVNNLGVFKTVWEWVPGPTDTVDYSSGYARNANSYMEGFNRCTGGLSSYSFPGGEGSNFVVPVHRASAFTVKDGADVDWTTSFFMTGLGITRSLEPQYLLQVDDLPNGAEDVVVQLTSGFATSDQLPADMLEILFQITADNFENREAHLVPGVDNVKYSNSMMTGWWMPRC